MKNRMNYNLKYSREQALKYFIEIESIRSRYKLDKKKEQRLKLHNDLFQIFMNLSLIDSLLVLYEIIFK